MILSKLFLLSLSHSWSLSIIAWGSTSCHLWKIRHRRWTRTSGWIKGWLLPGIMWPRIEPLWCSCCFLSGLSGRIFFENSAFRQVRSFIFGFLHALLLRWGWLESWLKLMLLPHFLRSSLWYSLRFLSLDLLALAWLLINEAECVLHIWVVRISHCWWIKHIIPATLIIALIKLLLYSEVLLVHLIFDLLNLSLICCVYIESSIHFASTRKLVLILQLGKALVRHRKLTLLVHYLVTHSISLLSKRVFHNSNAFRT